MAQRQKLYLEVSNNNGNYTVTFFNRSGIRQPLIGNGTIESVPADAWQQHVGPTVQEGFSKVFRLELIPQKKKNTPIAR